MTERVIPIADWRSSTNQPAPPSPPASSRRLDTGRLTDALHRPLHDLRISVTDRCNFRCTYCMPKEVFDKDYHFLPRSALLDFDEITRLARLFVERGVEKIRLTGGEPLLRKDLEILIGKLADLRLPDGRPPDLTLTTNGSLLALKAQALKDAGLRRITISLDALDETIFRRMNDVDFPVSQVLAGIKAAEHAGLAPIKINMVVQRGVNDGEIVPMARHFRHSGHIVRFIEYMDVGSSNGWKLDEVVPSAEVIRRIAAEQAIEPVDADYPGEVAQRWRYPDGSGEIGVISSVTQAFCHACTRARLSTEGRLYTCLFATQGTDLRAPLRNGGSDAELGSLIESVWEKRVDRYSELRGEATLARQNKIEMSYIGG